MSQPTLFSDGYRLIDGTTLNAALANPIWSTDPAAVATVGGTSITSYKITKTITNIVTVGALHAGVTLPEAIQPGTILVLFNSTLTDARVFAAGDSTIDGVPGNVGFVLYAGTSVMLTSVALNDWIQAPWSLDAMIALEQQAAASAAAAAASATTSGNSAIASANSATASANSASSAANSASAAAASEAQALIDANASAASAATAATQASNAVAAANTAVAAEQAVQFSKGFFATTAAAIGLGVAGSGPITGGSTGTDGTFTLAFTGGTGSGAAGVFLVSGGSVTSILITAPGSYTVAPTFDFSASAGLVGASATCLLARNVDVGEYFSTPSSTATNLLDFYRVNAGPVATYLTSYPSSALLSQYPEISLNAAPTVSASVYTENVGTVSPSIYRAFNLVTGTSYDVVVIARANSNYFVNVYYALVGHVTDITIDLENGEVIPGSLNTNATATATLLGNGWWKIVVTSLITGAGGVSNVQLRMLNAAQQTTYTGNGVSNLDVYYLNMFVTGLTTPLFTTSDVSQAYWTKADSIAPLTTLSNNVDAVTALDIVNSVQGALTIGKASITTQVTSWSAVYFILKTPAKFDGFVVSASIAVTAPQLVTVSVYDVDPVLLTATVIATTSFLATAGLNVDVPVNLPIAAGQYVGFYCAIGPNAVFSGGRVWFSPTAITTGSPIVNSSPVVVECNAVIEGETNGAITVLERTGGSTYNARYITPNWSGVKVACLGTSITSQNYYTSRLPPIMGITLTNLGFSGGCLGIPNPIFYGSQKIYDQIALIPTDTQVVTIEAGTNDFAYNTPLGALGDTTLSTFYGAIYAACDAIRIRAPNAQIIFFTPYSSGSAVPAHTIFHVNTNGNTLSQFQDAVRAGAAFCGYAYIDVGTQSGIGYFTAGTYFYDGLHLNTTGGNRYAYFVAKYLNDLGVAGLLLP